MLKKINNSELKAVRVEGPKSGHRPESVIPLPSLESIQTARTKREAYELMEQTQQEIAETKAAADRFGDASEEEKLLLLEQYPHLKHLLES